MRQSQTKSGTGPTHVLRAQKGHRPPLHRRNPPRLPASLRLRPQPCPQPAIDLLDLSGRVIPLLLNDIKHICYVRDFNLTDTVNPERLTRRTFLARPRTEGLWLRLTFRTRRRPRRPRPHRHHPPRRPRQRRRPPPHPTRHPLQHPAHLRPPHLHHRAPAPRRHHHPLPPQTPPRRLRPLHAGRPLRRPHPPNSRPN